MGRRAVVWGGQSEHAEGSRAWSTCTVPLGLFGCLALQLVPEPREGRKGEGVWHEALVVGERGGGSGTKPSDAALLSVDGVDRLLATHEDPPSRWFGPPFPFPRRWRVMAPTHSGSTGWRGVGRWLGGRGGGGARLSKNGVVAVAPRAHVVGNAVQNPAPRDPHTCDGAHCFSPDPEQVLRQMVSCCWETQSRQGKRNAGAQLHSQSPTTLSLTLGCTTRTCTAVNPKTGVD